MSNMEELELLKAALAVAVADGEIRRSEKGVIEGLAARVGVGRASLQAMTEAAEQDDSLADNILIRSSRAARRGFELLVAHARIDGEISESEREVLVRLASALKIPDGEFVQIYEAGIKRADAIRRSRGHAG